VLDGEVIRPGNPAERAPPAPSLAACSARPWSQSVAPALRPSNGPMAFPPTTLFGVRRRRPAHEPLQLRLARWRTAGRRDIRVIIRTSTLRSAGSSWSGWEELEVPALCRAPARLGPEG